MSEPQADPVSPALPIVATVIWLAAFIALAFVGMLSVMLFDAGTDNAWVWVIYTGIWGTVVLCVVSIVASWIAWGVTRRTRSGGSRIVRTIAYALPLLGIGVIVIGVLGVDTACGGNLSCG